jgi:hypothetical protein
MKQSLIDIITTVVTFVVAVLVYAPAIAVVLTAVFLVIGVVLLIAISMACLSFLLFIFGVYDDKKDYD